MYLRMEGEETPKRFTPMSGEKAMVDYGPHDPAEDDRNRVAPEKRAPTAAIAFGVVALLGGTSGGWSFRGFSGGGGYDRAERAAALNWSTFFAGLAILLFAFGLLLDYML
jgi:hypothetical protein